MPPPHLGSLQAPAMKDALRGAAGPAALLLALAGCGPGSVPVERGASEAAAPGGAAGVPADPHAGLWVPPAARFAGVVRLQGALAEKKSGFLFVSIKPKGIAMPCYSRKYSLADEELEPGEGGERVLRFELDQSHSLGGLVDGELVAEAYFDPDGLVDTKEPEIVRASVATQPDDEGLELVLKPSE